MEKSDLNVSMAACAVSGAPTPGRTPSSRAGRGVRPVEEGGDERRAAVCEQADRVDSAQPGGFVRGVAAAAAVVPVSSVSMSRVRRGVGWMDGAVTFGCLRG